MAARLARDHDRRRESAQEQLARDDGDCAPRGRRLYESLPRWWKTQPSTTLSSSRQATAVQALKPRLHGGIWAVAFGMLPSS
ncbi:hypothetical protein PHYSODRAFT_285366, partial [Phytophthora sojae]